jgi:cytoskeleton protein RodZ
MEISNVVANAGKETEPKQTVLNVGMALRDAREQQGMSVHDVAERIKFAPRQVEALEANDFAHLPEATFLRGFVRSYARVLQLDEASLLAALPAGLANQPTVRTQMVNVAFPSIRSLRSINVIWLGGAVGVALLLGLFVLLSDSELDAKKAEVVVENVPLPLAESAVSAVVNTEFQPEPPAVVAVSEPNMPLDSKKAPEPKKTLEPKKAPESKKIPELKNTPELKKISESKNAPELKKILEPVKTVPPVINSMPQIEGASAPVATNTSIPLEVLKRRPLHFVFNENSWTEVLDARGVVLLSRTNLRGTEKWVGGPRHEPYDVSIAHPANVKLYFRGKEIDLSAYAGMDVVHLKLE